MKVLHIITGLSTGGAETMLYKLLKNLDQSSFNCTVVSLTDYGEFGKNIEALGIKVIALNMRASLTLHRSLFQLVKIIKNNAPDVVQTWMYHADLLGGLTARLAGVSNIVWNIRNSDLDPSRTKKHTRLTVKLCALLSNWVPKKIICNSRQSTQVHQKAGYNKDRFVIIPNGFDTQIFFSDREKRKAVRKELGLGDDVFLIGLVARFDPQKNHKGFIEAAALLNDKMKSVHFLLCGKDIDINNKKLMHWIKSAGLEDNVHLLGLRTDIARLTASFDLATSSSHGEAFPNVIGEAMSCSVPCVVTDVGDSAWIVGETGKVVPSDNPQALADAWETLSMKSTDERNELGRLARKRIEDNFSIETVTKLYEQLYMKVTE